MTVVRSVVQSVVQPVVQSVLGSSGPVPIFHMPLANSLDIPIGIGPATFTRATTGTYVDKNDGLIKTAAINDARFEADGQLIEGPSENLSDHSEDVTHWNGFRLVETLNAAAAPDGTMTMDHIARSTDSGQKRASIRGAVTLGVRYVASVHVSKAELDYVQMTGSTASFASEYVTFDLAAGAVGNNNLSNGIASIRETYSGSGIYRCSLSLEATITGTGDIFSSPQPTNAASRFPGTVGNDVDGIYVWGRQFEEGSSPSSYIPTITTTAARSSDNLSIDSDNLPAPGSDYSISMDVTLRHPRPSGATTFVLKVNGEANRRIYFNSNNTAVYQHTGLLTTSALPTTSFKLVVTKNDDLMAVYVDGGLDSSQAPGVVTGTKNNIQIGRDGTTASRYLNGHLKNIKIFDKTLTASEVAKL